MVEPELLLVSLADIETKQKGDPVIQQVVESARNGGEGPACSTRADGACFLGDYVALLERSLLHPWYVQQVSGDSQAVQVMCCGQSSTWRRCPIISTGDV